VCRSVPGRHERRTDRRLASDESGLDAAQRDEERLERTWVHRLVGELGLSREDASRLCSWMNRYEEADTG
jgi:hypothetical protein